LQEGYRNLANYIKQVLSKQMPKISLKATGPFYKKNFVTIQVTGD
jgi:hypothetical protein